jgi:hypothetical protein
LKHQPKRLLQRHSLHGGESRWLSLWARCSGRITAHPEPTPKPGCFPIGDDTIGTQKADCALAQSALWADLVNCHSTMSIAHINSRRHHCPFLMPPDKLGRGGMLF